LLLVVKALIGIGSEPYVYLGPVIYRTQHFRVQSMQ